MEVIILEIPSQWEKWNYCSKNNVLLPPLSHTHTQTLATISSFYQNNLSRKNFLNQDGEWKLQKFEEDRVYW